MRIATYAWLAILLIAVVSCGGGGGSTAPPFMAERDALPVFPGASVVRDGASLAGDTSSTYASDRLYRTATEAAPGEIVEWMTTSLKEQGWAAAPVSVSTPAEGSVACQPPVLACASFTKAGVRLTVTAAAVIGFGGQAPPSLYHVHFEKE